MLETYTDVEGDSLAALLTGVKAQFTTVPPVDECDGYRIANSVRAVALDVFERAPEGQRAAVVADLLNRNGGLLLALDDANVFTSARTAAEFMTDLVCEVVAQILRRQPEVEFEDNCRIAEARDR